MEPKTTHTVHVVCPCHTYRDVRSCAHTRCCPLQVLICHALKCISALPSVIYRVLQVPIEVGLPDPVVQVAAGENHTVCLTGALKPADPHPHTASAATLLVCKHPDVATMYLCVCVCVCTCVRVCLTESGEVWAWGSHESGQLGIGSTGNDVVHKIPRLVKELSGVYWTVHAETHIPHAHTHTHTHAVTHKHTHAHTHAHTRREDTKTSQRAVRCAPQ